MLPPGIRLARPDDFAALAAITNHYIRTTAIHFGVDDVTADELRDTWHQHVDLYPWLCATDGDEVVGYAKAGVFRARAAYRWITETGIYLRPERCRRGLGTVLYGALLEVLRVQGFHAAIGGIALPNAASVALHERLGFVAVGVVPRAGRKFDRWHDVGFWHLGLQATDHVPEEPRSPEQAFLRCARSGDATEG
jgi:phosphinothricin acetyltransferase